MSNDIDPEMSAPVGACDCQAHVFGDPARYPTIPSSTYKPPKASFNGLRAAQAAAGVDRVVLVQATAYGTDHALLLDTLRAHPECRGVATVDNTVTDAQLRELHRSGVRGARFGLGSSLQRPLPRDEFDRSLARITELGWHAKIVCSADDLVAHASWLEKRDLPIVLDHLAGLGADRQRDAAAFELVVSLLRGGAHWIMFSNADRRSAQNEMWKDMEDVVSACFAVAPERTLWATDWPHLRYAKPSVPAMKDLVAFILCALPDPEAARKVLVENPSRLYFAD